MTGLHLKPVLASAEVIQREMKKRLGVGADTIDTLGGDDSFQVVDDHPEGREFPGILGHIRRPPRREYKQRQTSIAGRGAERIIFAGREGPSFVRRYPRRDAGERPWRYSQERSSRDAQPPDPE